VLPTADLVGNQLLWEWSIYLWVTIAKINGKSQRIIMILYIRELVG
jgi:hypothetical protein